MAPIPAYLDLGAEGRFSRLILVPAYWISAAGARYSRLFLVSRLLKFGGREGVFPLNSHSRLLGFGAGGCSLDATILDAKKKNASIRSVRHSDSEVMMTLSTQTNAAQYE